MTNVCRGQWSQSCRPMDHSNSAMRRENSDRMHRPEQDKSGQRPLFRERESALPCILT
jgi:hypothetical protein